MVSAVNDDRLPAASIALSASLMARVPDGEADGWFPLAPLEIRGRQTAPATDRLTMRQRPYRAVLVVFTCGSGSDGSGRPWIAAAVGADGGGDACAIASDGQGRDAGTGVWVVRERWWRNVHSAGGSNPVWHVDRGGP